MDADYVDYYNRESAAEAQHLAASHINLSSKGKLPKWRIVNTTTITPNVYISFTYSFALSLSVSNFNAFGDQKKNSLSKFIFQPKCLLWNLYLRTYMTPLMDVYMTY